MKKNLLLLALIVSFLLVGNTASALTIFSDNFNSENTGSGVLNYNLFDNWTVTEGTVDLIGNGFYDFYPGNGLYIDMDGSTGNAGKLTSIDIAVSFGTTYELSFDLAGNARNYPIDSLDVTVFISDYMETFTVAANDAWTNVTRQFTVYDPDEFAQIIFNLDGGDNVGAIIDNVAINTVDSPAPVPEPATMLLLGTGLIGLAATSRKKIFKKK